ncbi:MAG TPA: hypothetical protein VG714_03395 [Acidobacteriaceae bacterium]|nr:hypothetical protein [Acidobacteriaceae bacterium]
MTPMIVPAQGPATGLSTRIARPELTLGDTLTVTASPGAVSFTLVPGGIATGSSSVTVTTNWTGISLLSSVRLYGSFSSATTALSGGTPVSYIPSSAVLGKVATGTPTTYTPFTQTNPLGGAGASLLLFSQTSILSLSGNRSDNLDLEINLTSLPQLPAATYTGVLTLQAQAL